MKKFNFRLEKIKRFKEQLEQDKKMKLAAERNRLQNEKLKLAEIITTRDKYFTRYSIRKPGKLNIAKLIIAKRYLDKLAGDILEQRKKITGVEADVKKAQEDLLEASKEKKKYEKLRNRHLALYNEESSRAENRELDEFGSRGPKHDSSVIRATG